jgi:hypothetical protein
MENPGWGDRDWVNNVTTVDGQNTVRCFNIQFHSGYIDGFTITGGNETNGGGILISSYDTTIANCIITGNNASSGGGIRVSNAALNITNCIITGNNASSFGGGIMNSTNGAPTITHCTFSGNTATTHGDAIANSSTTAPIITNCILWDDGVEEIYDTGASISNVTYSDVDQAGYAGSNGNISQDPLFIGGGSYKLSTAPVSPCINTGTDAGVSNDIEGTARPQDSGYDMGAYEMILDSMCQDDNECDDGNPCTDDTCNTETGDCEYSNNTNQCDDENPCTENDTCSEGNCQGDPIINCDNSNINTDDACNLDDATFTANCIEYMIAIYHTTDQPSIANYSLDLFDISAMATPVTTISGSFSTIASTSDGSDGIDSVTALWGTDTLPCGSYTVSGIVSLDCGGDPKNLKTCFECPCDTDTCTLTQGFWKTHSKYGPAPYDDTWKLVGEDNVFFLSGKSYYEVLWTPPKHGNAYYILAHQYIAAKLNEQNGASVDDVSAALTSAEALFGLYTPDDEQVHDRHGGVRPEFISLAEILDHYNRGEIGPGHCTELERKNHADEREWEKEDDDSSDDKSSDDDSSDDRSSDDDSSDD